MVFFVVIGMMVSSKFRSTITGHQLKIQKRILEDNKETIKMTTFAIKECLHDVKKCFGSFF